MQVRAPLQAALKTNTLAGPLASREVPSLRVLPKAPPLPGSVAARQPPQSPVAMAPQAPSGWEAPFSGPPSARCCISSLRLSRACVAGALAVRPSRLPNAFVPRLARRRPVLRPAASPALTPCTALAVGPPLRVSPFPGITGPDSDGWERGRFQQELLFHLA